MYLHSYRALQKKLMRMRATDKYEKKIHELTAQCQLKTNECHEAWMSLAATNEQLRKVRMELDNNIFQTRSLGNFGEFVFINHILKLKR